MALSHISTVIVAEQWLPRDVASDMAGAVKLISQERIRWRTVEQMVDVLVPIPAVQTVERTVELHKLAYEVVKLTQQDQVENHTVDALKIRVQAISAEINSLKEVKVSHSDKLAVERERMDDTIEGLTTYRDQIRASSEQVGVELAESATPCSVEERVETWSFISKMRTALTASITTWTR